MILYTSVFSVFLLFLQNTLGYSASPVLDRNDGGDLIICEGNEGQLSGVYSLDYVASYAFNPESDTYVADIRWENSYHRLYKLLLPLVPRMAVDLREFAKDLYNHNRLSRTHWIGYPLRIPVEVNTLVHSVPEECMFVTEEGEKVPNIFQGIIKEERDNGRVVFHYNSTYFGPNRTGILAGPSESFVYVHEWLRAYGIEPHIIRDLNTLFHSDQMDDYRSENLQTILEQYRVDLYGTPDKSVRSVLIHEVDGEIIFEGYHPFDFGNPNDTYIEYINETPYYIDIEMGSERIYPHSSEINEVYEFFYGDRSFRVLDRNRNEVGTGLHNITVYQE